MIPTDRHPPHKAPIADIAALAGVLVLVGGAGGQSLAYGLWVHGEPGPGLFPFIACVLTAFATVVALIVCICGGEVAAADDADGPAQEGPVQWRNLAVYIGVALIWPLLMAPLGFVIATALALLVVLRLGERVAWPRLAIILIGTVGASWLVFDRLLGVPLPIGLLGVG